jgi:uncharacterized membrane protein YidH (DUF202 family)
VTKEMDTLMTVLKGLIIIILIAGLIYTAKLGANQRKGKNEVSDDVVNHPVFRNPVFLTYALFTVIVLVLIFVVATYF